MDLREQYEAMPAEVLERTLSNSTLLPDDEKLCKQVLYEKTGQTFIDKQNFDATNIESTSFRSNYGAARIIAIFISFIGWLILLAGIIMVGLAGATLMESSRHSFNSVAVLGLLPGIGVALSGIMLIATGQITRATVDNADQTREILKMIRAKS